MYIHIYAYKCIYVQHTCLASSYYLTITVCDMGKIWRASNLSPSGSWVLKLSWLYGWSKDRWYPSHIRKAVAVWINPRTLFHWWSPNKKCPPSPFGLVQPPFSRRIYHPTLPAWVGSASFLNIHQNKRSNLCGQRLCQDGVVLQEELFEVLRRRHQSDGIWSWRNTESS